MTRKFKVGDKIRYKDSPEVYTVVKISDQHRKTGSPHASPSVTIDRQILHDGKLELHFWEDYFEFAKTVGFLIE